MENSEIKKLCECGCGKSVLLYKWTDNRIQSVKGTPAKFIPGHNLKNHQLRGRLHPRWRGIKIQKNGYIWIYTPEHPRNTQGYVYEHTLKAEKALGNFLPVLAMVHHHDKSQLVICQDQAYQT